MAGPEAGGESLVGAVDRPPGSKGVSSMRYSPSRKALGLVAASAVLLAGTVAVTPAGAVVQDQAADGWGKIWKKKLQPKADKRYWTKAQADAKYAGRTSSYTKPESDARYYTRTESDGKYYSKTDADAKYQAKQQTYRGQYMMGGNGAGTLLASDISFGVTLAEPPQAHYIQEGTAVPAGCTGTASSPGADPGHLCVFEADASNVQNVRRVTNQAYTLDTATPVGAYLWGYVNAAGIGYAAGSWAMQPGGAAVVTAKGSVDLGPVGRLR